ncbi:MAG: serine hydrolase [Flavobacteriales bacterium]|nr:serine hydrolase [Flavobacteriales bacterium]
MPRLIKFILFIFILLGVGILGLYITDNEHVLTALRSTYLIGRSGPDTDNHKFFENRTVQATDPQPWEYHEDFNSHRLSLEDSTLLAAYRTTSFLVIHKGKILYENYWEDGSDTMWSNSFSMAKSITSMLIGEAIEDGLIRSVEDKASDYLTDLKGTDKEDVTIKHLLQMTAGIGFDEHYGDPFGFMAKANYGDEMYQKTLSYPQVYEPGTRWEYLGGCTLLLSYIVQEVTGKTCTEHAQERLWGPLGAEQDALWTYDPSTGRERAFCCFYSNATDFARFGQLFLCDGNWKGEQLISPQWVEESLTPCMVPDATGEPVDHYGYQWWLNSHKGIDVQCMRGLKGQYVIVIPEREAILVRLGHERSDERIDHAPKDVYEFLDIALKILPPIPEEYKREPLPADSLELEESLSP